MWADNADCESRRISRLIVLLLSSSCSPWPPHVLSFDNTIIVFFLFITWLIFLYSNRSVLRFQWIRRLGSACTWTTSSYHICWTHTRFSMPQGLAFNLHNIAEYFHLILSNHKYSIRILLCKCCWQLLFRILAKNLSKCFIKKFAYKVRLSTSTTCSRRRMARDCRLKFTFASFQSMFCFW